MRAKLTSKGQITVPVAVRRKLNLQPGDDLLFDLSADGEVGLAALKRKRLTELYASLLATRPYPGKAEVRREVANEIARQVGKGK